MTEIEVIRTNRSLEQIFANSENGSSEEPTKLGFLALARAGKEVWNTWRKEWPMPEGHSVAWPLVDFGNHQFNEETDFSGYEFGDFANFQGTTFVKKVDFTGAIFGSATNFVGASFQESVQFYQARFGSDAQFEAVQFAFGAGFSEAHFEGAVSFFGAQFGDDSDFDGVTFAGDVQFEGCNWAVLRLRYEESYLSRKKWAEGQQMSPSVFESLSFRGCTFLGEANYSNREFRGPATWESMDGRSTIFCKAPKFHNCKLHQDTSFEGAKFPVATGSENAARAYRTLKLASAQQQATREEQRFFKLEMAEEHLSLKEPRRWLYSAYAVTSDYGFSTGRPLALLVFTLLLSWLVYGLLAGYVICIPAVSTCAVSREWFEFGLVNAFPLPGLDKYAESLRVELFPRNLYPLAQVLVTVTVIVQKAISLLAFFLIGLAVRNLFKMK